MSRAYGKFGTHQMNEGYNSKFQTHLEIMFYRALIIGKHYHVKYSSPAATY